jgi:hypothetical protein
MDEGRMIEEILKGERRNSLPIRKQSKRSAM